MDVDPGSLPTGATMLRLEGEARRQGSGLTGDQLKGRWLVRHIWGKDGSRPLPTTELLLRRCEATLAIEQEDASDELRLTNSLALGWIKICFSGPGELRQRRPLLFFNFTRLRILMANHPILSISLPKPAPSKQPFFALIGSDTTTDGVKWLAARGRGGGLALWVDQKETLA